MLVPRRVGLEKATSPHEVLQQLAQFVIREGCCLSRRGSCVMQL
jgi:hypothetical protein